MLTEEIKMDMLNSIGLDKEEYKRTMWGVIIADSKVISDFAAFMDKHELNGGSYSALSNQYCFIGIKDNYLAFAGIDNLKPKKMINSAILPFEDIKKVQIKRSLFGRVIILILTKSGILKLILSKNTIGSKLDKQGQIDGINTLISNLQSLNK